MIIWGFKLHGNRWYGITLGHMFIGIVTGEPTTTEDA